MNLSTVALILLAWQLLAPNNGKRSGIDLTDMLSEDVKQAIDSAQKLTNGSCSQQDKAGAIFEIFANPAVQNFASGLFGTHEKAPEPPKKQAEPNVNSEGYRFETPSQASQEFFRPIDDIADAEVKHKLYWFYDNWYNK